MSKRTLIISASVAALLCVTSAEKSSATTVYFNDFQSNAGNGWSSQLRETAPNPDINPWWGTYLGQFSGDTAVTLTLDGLSAGWTTLSFDTYFIRSWDGNDDPVSGYGKDYFKVSIAGGQTLLYDTFSNGNPAGQSYIGNGIQAVAYDGSGNSSMTGSAQQFSLGYTFHDGINNTNEVMDSVYNFSFSFFNTLDRLTFEFAGIGLQGNLVDDLYFDESWGLDNVKVDIAPVPEPSTLLLLAGGLAGLLAYRRRERTYLIK
jgi:hypothetical protein